MLRVHVVPSPTTNGTLELYGAPPLSVVLSEQLRLQSISTGYPPGEQEIIEEITGGSEGSNVVGGEGGGGEGGGGDGGGGDGGGGDGGDVGAEGGKGGEGGEQGGDEGNGGREGGDWDCGGHGGGGGDRGGVVGGGASTGGGLVGGASVSETAMNTGSHRGGQAAPWAPAGRAVELRSLIACGTTTTIALAG